MCVFLVPTMWVLLLRSPLPGPFLGVFSVTLPPTNMALVGGYLEAELLLGGAAGPLSGAMSVEGRVRVSCSSVLSFFCFCSGTGFWDHSGFLQPLL